ncbi:hypothetical protein CR513_12250, partial [Mucuna pruriens]
MERENRLRGINSKVNELELRDQLNFLKQRLNLLEEEVLREWIFRENLEIIMGQSQAQLVEECRKVEDLEDWAQIIIGELLAE